VPAQFQAGELCTGAIEIVFGITISLTRNTLDW